jgi:hypothetical protein
MAIAATRRTKIKLYEFPLVGDPNGPIDRQTEDSIIYKLNDQELSEKVQVGLDYARAVSTTLLQEVQDSIDKFGTEMFRTERFMPVENLEYESRFKSTKPYYEVRGEERSVSGQYSEVIRLKEHLAPIARSLLENS